MHALTALAASNALPRPALAQATPGLPGWDDAEPIFNNPTPDDSVLGLLGDIAASPWTLGSLGVAGLLFFAAGGPQALLPSRQAKEEEALRLLGADRRFAPLAQLLAQPVAADAGWEGMRWSSGIVHGSDFPAQALWRGAQLRLTGSAQEQAALVLALLQSISGRPFDSFNDVHAEAVAFDKANGCPQWCLQSSGDEGTSCVFWFANRGQTDDDSSRLHEHLRQATPNPAGYYFTVDRRYHCTIRPLPEQAGVHTLAVQLRRSNPATPAGDYRPVRHWHSVRGPGGHALPWARYQAALPEAV